MIGRQAVYEQLFYDFHLDDHVPAQHLLHQTDVDLEGVRQELKPYFSTIGRPSIDTELMIRVQIIGYCYGIRAEHRLCEDVHLNLAFRWFCRLDLNGKVPDKSTLSKNRHGQFLNSDLFCRVFEGAVQRCIDEGLVSGEDFADDAAFGATSVVTPKFIPPSNPAAQWAGALKGPAFFAMPPTI